MMPIDTKFKDRLQRLFEACGVDGGLAVQAGPNGLATIKTHLHRTALGRGEVLIEIIATTVCEADRRMVGGTKAVDDAPSHVITGHEAVGRVIKLGGGGTLRRGQYVVVMPHIVVEDASGGAQVEQGRIYRCRTRHAGMGIDGTHAGQMVWPEECLMLM